MKASNGDNTCWYQTTVTVRRHARIRSAMEARTWECVLTSQQVFECVYSVLYENRSEMLPDILNIILVDAVLPRQQKHHINRRTLRTVAALRAKCCSPFQDPPYHHQGERGHIGNNLKTVLALRE